MGGVDCGEASPANPGTISQGKRPWRNECQKGRLIARTGSEGARPVELWGRPGEEPPSLNTLKEVVLRMNKDLPVSWRCRREPGKDREPAHSRRGD